MKHLVLDFFHQDALSDFLMISKEVKFLEGK